MQLNMKNLAYGDETNRNYKLRKHEESALQASAKAE